MQSHANMTYNGVNMANMYLAALTLLTCQHVVGNSDGITPNHLPRTLSCPSAGSPDVSLIYVLLNLIHATSNWEASNL